MGGQAVGHAKRRHRSPLAALVLVAAALAGAACAGLPDQISMLEPEPASANNDQQTFEPSTAATSLGPQVLDTRLAAQLAELNTPAERITPPSDRQIILGFTGDTLMHSPLWDQARKNAQQRGAGEYDFTPMMSGLHRVLGGVDLGICHLETPIAPVGEPLSTAPLYGVPPEVVEAIVAAGHQRCSTASNHALDRGVNGIARTIEVLEEWGVSQHGMARTPEEIEPSVFDVGGIAITHLSYTYSYNGLRPPRDEPWRSALIDTGRIIEDARRARELGAEVVVISMHWGNEGSHAVSGLQRSQATAITNSGLVDLIVGHHAHVVQPIEIINGVPVIFGLGNIISNLPVNERWPAASQDAAVAVVDISVDSNGNVSVGRPIIHPTWVDKDAGWVVRLVLDELADADLSDGLRQRLEQSLRRTERVLGDWLPLGG
jgi:poly-gamma-glutamate capsule biosynthesis protein CapA/YwtB (metallophosphatase superfamily)